MNLRPFSSHLESLFRVIRELSGIGITWKDSHAFLRASMPHDLVRQHHPRCMQTKRRNRNSYQKCVETCKYGGSRNCRYQICHAGFVMKPLYLTYNSQQMARLNIGPFFIDLPRMGRTEKKRLEQKLKTIERFIISEMPYLFELRQRELWAVQHDKLHPALQHALASFEDSPSHAKSAGELARKAGMSVSRLQHICRQQTGNSLLHAQTQILLREACRRLLISETIKSVAYDLGFADQRNFATWFRRNCGKTPSQWMKEQKNAV